MVRENRVFSKETHSPAWDLLSFIPSLDRLYETVKDELLKFSQIYQKYTKGRLIENGIEVKVSSIAMTILFCRS